MPASSCSALSEIIIALPLHFAEQLNRKKAAGCVFISITDCLFPACGLQDSSKSWDRFFRRRDPGTYSPRNNQSINCVLLVVRITNRMQIPRYWWFVRTRRICGALCYYMAQLRGISTSGAESNPLHGVRLELVRKAFFSSFGSFLRLYCIWTYSSQCLCHELPPIAACGI